MKVKVIAGANTGITPELADRFGIALVPYYVSYKGQTFNVLELDYEELLAWLSQGDEPVTVSHPTVQDLIEAFRRAEEEAEAALHITISSRQSKVFDLATAVKERFLESGSKLRIEVVDSGRVMGGHGLLALEAARLALQGSDIDDILGRMGELQGRVDEIIVARTLKRLAKEGRIQGAQEAISSMISFKPLIAHRDGIVTPIGRARTNSQALEFILDRIGADLEQFKASGLHCIVEYLDDLEWAEGVAERLKREFSPQEIWVLRAAADAAVRIGPSGSWSVAWYAAP